MSTTDRDRTHQCRMALRAIRAARKHLSRAHAYAEDVLVLTSLTARLLEESRALFRDSLRVRAEFGESAANARPRQETP